MNVAAIPAAFDLFRKGSAVADPELLQDRGKLAIAISAVLTAGAHLAGVLGHPLPVDTDTIDQIAGGLAAAAYLVVHYGASTSRGVLPAKPGDGVARDRPAGEQGPLAAPVGGEPADPVQPSPVRDQRTDPTNFAGG